MTITAALVTFAVSWFIVFFCVLPIQFRSQAEEGFVVPGTPASAPADAMIGKKAKITTGIAIVVFAVIYAIVVSGVVTLDNMDFLGVMS